MKYIRHITLVVGLILMIFALTIMFRQTIGKYGVSSDPVYVQDVPEYISLKQN